MPKTKSQHRHKYFIGSIFKIPKFYAGDFYYEVTKHCFACNKTVTTKHNKDNQDIKRIYEGLGAVNERN